VRAVKHLIATPEKSEGEILFCNTSETWQVFSAAACSWGGKMIQSVKRILEDGLNIL